MQDQKTVCRRCVMDTETPGISFDEDGICNYCRDFERRNILLNMDTFEKRDKLDARIRKIKKSANKKEYDCIIGVSGGVDSTYAAYLAKNNGLRALLVHLDNGWNSELSVKNIENTLNYLDYDLYTHVIDWNEFRDMQRSFFYASVIDIEMLTDHAIGALLYSQAAKRGIRHIVTGSNSATEGGMPEGWYYKKMDIRNIKGIHKRFGTVSLKTFPCQSLWKRIYRQKVRCIQVLPILDYVDYRREQAVGVLEREMGWRDYGGKHFESIFTRFYQGYILPQKFKVDKRRLHYSNLVRSGQLSRSRAVQLLTQEAYPSDRVEQDTCYVLKKLGISKDDFSRYLKSPPVPHNRFPNYEKELRVLRFLRDRIGTTQEVA